MHLTLNKYLLYITSKLKIDAPNFKHLKIEWQP